MKKVLLLLCLICSMANIASAVKTDYRNALIFAYSPVNSVFEDDNIKLEIYNEQLWATNKTAKTIFIDRSQCFLEFNGSSYPMYEKQTDEKKASKAGVSTSIDEFIAIAPNTGRKQNETFICNLAARIYGKYSTTEETNRDFSEYEERLLSTIGDLLEESLAGDPKGKKYLGAASRHLTEDESVSNIGASLAYAFNKRAEEWTSVSVSTWVCDIIFAPYYIEMPKDISKKEKKGFGIKETKPAVIHVKADSPFEFEQDKSPIIIADWTGDYKKGEFDLAITKISKVKKTNKFLAALATIATGGYGAALFFTPLSETYYKDIINFDGANSDWGKLNYSDDKDLTKTGQSE